MRPVLSPISPPPTAADISSSSSSNGEITNNWGPYAGAGDFKANALLILSAVFCSVLIFLAVTSIIRFLFCASDDDDGEADGDEEKKGVSGPPPEYGPVLVFTKARQRELVGAEAECAICLSEFADGDEVRVLPACHHGFHVACVERWLSLRCSCPTCRASTLIAAAAAGGCLDQHVPSAESIV